MMERFHRVFHQEQLHRLLIPGLLMLALGLGLAAGWNIAQEITSAALVDYACDRHAPTLSMQPHI
jgi:hypothetical protein